MSSTDLRALVVEDDRSWQQILSEILTDAGLQVDIAEDLEGARAALRADPHRIAVVDLALSGNAYSDREGLRVLDAVRNQDPGCVAIMLTGFATVELAVNVLTEYGAFSCLRKETFNRADFRDLVSRALASATPSQDDASRIRVTSEDASHNDLQTEATTRPTELALVVEDDAGWRSILKELLMDIRYQVRLCNSFGEALGYLQRERFQVAVVDLSLAGAQIPSSQTTLAGYQLLESTHKLGIPTIVVSGVAKPDEIERAYTEQGIFAYVEKQTFDRRAFLQAIYEASQAERIPEELQHLTEREREVLECLAQGLTNKEIAENLFITTNTVKRHLKAIFSKLDVHTRAAAASKAISAGIVVTKF